MARGKGEGSIYKRASDGMWCTSIELPAGLDGKRRRKVVCRRSKAEVVAELGRLQTELFGYGDTGPDMTLQEAVQTILDAINSKPGKPWRGTSRRFFKG